MSVQGITALITAVIGVITAITALLHSIQTRKQVKKNGSNVGVPFTKGTPGNP